MRRLVNPIAFLIAAVLASSAIAIEVVPLPSRPPDIPHGHLPPPGACRIWMPNEPPGQQPPPGSCGTLAREVPLGGWLVYRPTSDAVAISAYSVDVPDLVGELRYYDARTLAPLDGPPEGLPAAASEVPRGHLPPPGACRVWHPGRPAGQQPPPVACGEALADAPAGTWVLYRETAGTVVVTAYHPGVPGLVLDTEVFDLGD